MTTLLEPREFRVLEGLRFNPRKAFAGRIRGERLTRKKGISIEFSDYRDYAEGDDLRHLDWNVLARLEAPIMKTYRDEEDLAVHLLVDGSPSMEFGEPTKATSANKLATALGFLGLTGGDAVYLKRLGVRAAPMPALRGRSAFVRLNSIMASTPGETGPSTLSNSLKSFANSSARTGLVVLISDGMDPDIAGAIRAIGGRGHELNVLQVLSDVELDPDLEGDLRLLDAESSGFVEITANSGALKTYRENLKRHNEALREATLRVGGRHVVVNSSSSIELIVRDVLKREGWVA
jgi:uncharacterized protein (DUF58 family)